MAPRRRDQLFVFGWSQAKSVQQFFAPHGRLTSSSRESFRRAPSS
ncbi:hypothetical protein BZL29_8333 [Mycobacterium kansasii]|uniref:Uncharacterized protein n=1 Tax=Mycobacterium kansasii TaxID=1768 RepID=A0A1V3WAS4_MYCKA|nr:hypothetical protein BZL29_8333 [Mycobacterium kansasii]